VKDGSGALYGQPFLAGDKKGNEQPDAPQRKEVRGHAQKNILDFGVRTDGMQMQRFGVKTWLACKIL
jgi:hypothetical protein